MRLLLLTALLLATGLAAQAAPPARPPGQGHGGGNQGQGQSHGQGQGQNQGFVTSGTDQTKIVGYYKEEFSRGNCPPGLAKKNNGCMPPGQAKRWAVGRALPGDVLFDPLPAILLARIAAPPAGQMYVRVATDILLIATGTRMVIAAVADLTR